MAYLKVQVLGFSRR